MMFTRTLLVCAVLIGAHRTSATESCNLMNMYTGALQTCGLQWWRNEDLGQIINVTYKVSEMVNSALRMFGVPLDDINQLNIWANSTDKLAKIVESALTVEPYISFIAADLLDGFNVTEAELTHFGLPGALASRSNLTKMFSDYFKYSCTDHGPRPFVSCITNWANANCQAEDKPEVIVNFLVKMRDTYCTGTSADTAILNKLTGDLGTVYQRTLDWFRIYKDPQQPYLFGISDDSIVQDQDVWRRFGENIMAECGYLANIADDFGFWVSPRSTIGAGVIVEAILRAQDAASRCAVRAFVKIFPQFYEDNQKAIEHIQLAAGRYSMTGFTNNQTDVATVKRYSVKVYGDPHIMTYKASQSITCPAPGWSSYLSNEFFSLRGFAESVSVSRQATYVTKVEITFSDRNPSVSYLTEAGAAPSIYLNVETNPLASSTDDIKIVSTDNAVQITDLKSGAVFGFQKYRETYYFSVRMGENVFDGSLGMLITGCQQPTNISNSGGRSRRDVACNEACRDLPDAELYTDSCQYDCMETGDTNVGDIVKGIVNLEMKVEQEDAKVLSDLRVDSSSTSSPNDSSTASPSDSPSDSPSAKPSNSPTATSTASLSPSSSPSPNSSPMQAASLLLSFAMVVIFKLML